MKENSAEDVTLEDDQATFRGREIQLTMACRSKSFRLLSDREVIHHVSEMEGQLFQLKDTNEFHLRILRPDETVCALVLKDNGSKLTVVTQMHEHINYHKSHQFTLLSADSITEIFGEQRKTVTDERTSGE